MRRRAAAHGALGLALIAIALIVLGGLSAAAFFLRPPPTDQATLCRLDAPLTAHTIVLVDSTDRLEPRHRRKLRAVMAQERARLAQYQRLTLMRIDARRPQEPAMLFSRCLPRPPEQANPLFENARHAQERWDADFADALERATRRAQSGAGARASPLIAALYAIAADPDFGPEISARRLVLVSDLLEHDPRGFTLYREGAAFSDWRAASPRAPPELDGVVLRVAPLDRPDLAALQVQAREQFWPEFLAETSVESVSFDPAP